MQKTRMAVWNLAPGCARRHQGMIQGKNTKEILNNLMFNVYIFYGYGPVKLFITSPITISVSSVQLVKLLVTGTQQMGWEDPAEWSNRVTNLGDEVKIQQRHELFSSICWCVFYWNRSLSRCTQSIKTIQHSWQVMDWKQKDLNWDSKRSVDKFDENISDQWIEP